MTTILANVESRANSMLSALRRFYDAYVDTYRDASGELPKMMRLKRIHTGFVGKDLTIIVAV